MKLLSNRFKLYKSKIEEIIVVMHFQYIGVNEQKLQILILLTYTRYICIQNLLYLTYEICNKILIITQQYCLFVNRPDNLVFTTLYVEILNMNMESYSDTLN